MVPTHFCLLPGKSQQIYAAVFRVCLENCRPSRFLCDFETAAYKAAQEAFPTAKVQACNFHRLKNFYAHVEGEIRRRYLDDPDYAVIVRLITTVAYVPTEAVTHVFEELANYLETEYPELASLISYVENNYIGRRRRRGQTRIEPRYSHQLWGQYEACLEELARTTNEIEAFHRSIAASLGAACPSPWKWLSWLKSQLQKAHQTYVQLEAGQNVRPQSTYWISRTSQLRRMAERWEPGFAHAQIDNSQSPLLRYLFAFAHFFHLH